MVRGIPRFSAWERGEGVGLCYNGKAPRNTAGAIEGSCSREVAGVSTGGWRPLSLTATVDTSGGLLPFRDGEPEARPLVLAPEPFRLLERPATCSAK